MAGAGYCPKCGVPLKEDAAFCPKCGSQIGSSATPTNASSVIPARKSRKKLWVAIGVVIVIAIIALSAYAYENEAGHVLNPYRVRVSQVIWTSNGYSLGTSTGFSVKAGATPTVSITLYCYEGTYGGNTCSSGSVYVLTAGFGVASTNAPFTWSGGGNINGYGKATAVVTVQLTTPTSAFSGDLAIDLH